MKNVSMKATLAGLALSAATLLPASLQAQVTPLFVGAGSSALFNTLGFAAFEVGPAPFDYTLIGPNHWTYKSPSTSPTVYIHDNRTGGSVTIANEPANIWVAWNADAVASPLGPNPKVALYLQVDSTVGVRAAFAVPSTTVGITLPAGTAGQNLIPNTTNPDTALPAAILADINGAAINIAGADIRPEDAKFATTRTLTALGANVSGGTSILSQVTGLGYGGFSGPSVGYPIVSAKSGAIANPVDFALYGKDPISGQNAVAYFKTYNLGAGPVVVIGNVSNSGSGHLGDVANIGTNIDSWTLSGFLDGSFSRTRDIPANSGLASVPVRTWLREPLSGTYNTLEFNVPNTFQKFSTQEKGITSVGAGATQNPLNDTYATGGGRSRAVGTGDEVSAVQGAVDSLGYTFWGYGNLPLSKVGPNSSPTIKYFTVDGVDPLYGPNNPNTQGTGIIPVVSGTTYPPLVFPNILNGSYPIWTTFRLVQTPTANAAEVQAFVNSAQAQAYKIYDFIPATSLQVFRSHFFTAGIAPSNGHVFDSADGVYYNESGGDVGGAVFPIQADYDFIADSGHSIELINRHN